MATLKEVINIVETMLYKTEYNTVSAEREVAEEQKRYAAKAMLAYHSKYRSTGRKKG